MENGPDDQSRSDVQLFVQRGLNGFAEACPDIEAMPQRLRDAYGYAWRRLHDFLFAEQAPWQTATTPRDRLAGVFSRLWEVEDAPALLDCTYFAFTGYWQKERGNMLSALLYEGQPADPYADDQLRQRLEDLCRESDLHKPPEYIAQVLINYGAVVYLARLTYPEVEPMTAAEAQLGVHNLITEW